MQAKSTLAISFTALGVAIIATLAQIALPIKPVPFTCLTIGVGLVATLLKPRDAFMAGLIYLILGGIGLPVFANASGGFQHLFGPTGGFLWGVLAYCLLTGSTTNLNASPAKVFFANLIGDSLLFLLGFIGLIFRAKLNPEAAFLAGVAPFILLDIIKIILITVLTKLLQPILNRLDYFKK